MNVRLVVEQGARRRVMNLRPPEALLGRAHGNTVRIPSAEVSRRHCRLSLKDGLVTIEDLDSVNGTFLNGRRITTIEYVQPGDQVDVGPVSFKLEYELTAAARARLRGDDELGEGDIEIIDGFEMDNEDLPVLEAISEDDEEMPEVEPIEAEEMIGAEFELDESEWGLSDDAPTHFPRPQF